MGSTTTAFPTSAKQELAQAMHNYTAPIGFTANTNTSNTLTSMSSQANLCRGMPLSAGGDIPASCFIVDLPTASTATIYPAATGTHTAQSLTANGDLFNVALIKATPTGVYGAASTNYSQLTGASDEASGTGYTAGGQALATNQTPTTSGTTAYWSWSVSPSWTTVSVSVQGCEFYHNDTRAGAAGRVVYVGDFGGTQMITGGTLTLVLPTNNSSNAVLRLQ
jgi:hypothetical protein